MKLTVGLSRTVYEINSDFSRKSQIIPTSVYFATPLKGFPLEFGIGAWLKKTRMMGLPGRERSITISSAIWIEYTNVTDRRTDGHTDKSKADRLCKEKLFRRSVEMFLSSVLAHDALLRRLKERVLALVELS